MDIQLKRGLLDVCVLAAIKDEETYGYKIIKDMKPYVELSESTLYTILKRLETAGMLTVWLVWAFILVYLHKAAPGFFLLYGLTLPGYLCAMLYNGVFENLETEGE